MKELKKKLLNLGASLGIAATLSYSTLSNADTPKQGGTLVWAMSAGHGVLDPQVSCGWLSKFVNYQIFESLVEADLTSTSSPTKLKGQLAESWDISEDGTVYTFILRKGVKFHDGTPVNAAAVKFNYDRFLNPEAKHFSKTANAYMDFIRYVGDIKSVSVIDDHTVQITLNSPNFEFLRTGMEDCPQMYITSPAAIEVYGDKGLPLNPVGTGPFKFESREEGVQTVLVRNDDYWGKKANLDRVVFKPLTDVATRMNALRANEVHVIQEPSWDEADLLKEDGFIVTQNKSAPTIWYLSFNMKNEVMKDVKVRQAINYAINREGIAKYLLQGNGKPAYGMLNAGTAAFNPDYVSYPYDPEKAKQLLAEAGYDDGLTLEMDVMIYGYGELLEKWIQRDLKKVGINLNLNKYEWLAYLDRWVPGMTKEVHMNEMLWGQQTPRFTAFNYRCDRTPPTGNNIGWYCNDEVDKLFIDGLQTADVGERSKLFQKADALAMSQDAPNAPIYHYFNPIAVNPKVKGFVNAAANWYDMSTVWLND